MASCYEKTDWRKQVSMALLASICLFQAAGAYAQSAADIEKIVKSSKWVESKRPVRAVLSGGQVSISTYCHPRASDQDCKINALFMLKELLGHYKTISLVRISFYDPSNASTYRTCEVHKEDVAKVDGGEPVKDVLSQIRISRGQASANAGGQQSNAVASGTASRAGGDFSSDLGEVVGLVMKHAGNLGALAPVPGPYESDRGLIASVVLEKKRSGYDTASDEAMVANLNRLASKGDSTALAKKISEAFSYLRISQEQVTEWRNRPHGRGGWGRGGHGGGHWGGPGF